MERQSVRKPRVVHLSGDFPDPVNTFKTPVIRSLIELTSDRFEHQVYSINRQSPGIFGLLYTSLRQREFSALRIEPTPFPWGTSLTYAAPGRGIFHATMLKKLGIWLAENLAKKGRPDLLVGHKLTIEGIAIAHAARVLGIPYAITIQGNTDSRILAARPDLRRLLGRVFHEAAVVVPFTPWALAAAEKHLYPRTAPTFLIPCPTDMDEIALPIADGDVLLTVFNLWNYRGKNLPGMVRAMQLLQRDDATVRLSVIGGGTEQEIAECRTLSSNVIGIAFEGAMDRITLHHRMRRAKGLVLPSLRESFGLVFTEALMAGLPIVYPAGTGIDGYLEGLPFAIRVDPRNPAAIAHAMQYIYRHENELKDALAQWQTTAEARAFTRREIAKRYSAALFAALEANKGSLSFQ